MPENASQIGSQLRAAREEAGLSQEEGARLVGVTLQTIGRWERGERRPRAEDFLRALDVYRKAGTARQSGDDQTVPRGTSPEDEWTPNPALAAAVPPRAYEVALGYLRRLERAGVPAEQIDEAERLMLDSRYAKLNKRTRELTDAEHIELIDATWEIVREVLGWQGIRP